jgi:TonB family protein
VFGAPDFEPLDIEEPEEPRQSRWITLFERENEDLEEEAWPYGGDPNVIFFLNERVSPSRLRIRDRRFIVVVILTLLFHLVLLSQLRSNSILAALNAAHAGQRPRPEEPVTPFYFVDMPKQRQEKPSRQRAPLSDMNRRAHGGEGEPADTPGSKGNTPELRLTPPGGQPAGQNGADRMVADANGQIRDPGRSSSQSSQSQAAQEITQKVADADPSAVLVMPPEQHQGESGGARLRGLNGLGGPGAQAGLAPNRRGGRVDLGPLSFDTQWYEWGPYAAEMLRRIRYHWEIPEIAMLGVGGVVRIRFYIERDGHVTGVEIERQSGHPSMDFAARDAILNASPLPPLPPDLTGVEREGVTIAFYYNTPIPESRETN